SAVSARLPLLTMGDINLIFGRQVHCERSRVMVGSVRGLESVSAAAAERDPPLNAHPVGATTETHANRRCAARPIRQCRWGIGRCRVHIVADSALEEAGFEH